MFDGCSCSHILDHAWMMAVQGNPDDSVCMFMAFNLVQFVFAQSLVVSLMALNSFYMVVRQCSL